MTSNFLSIFCDKVTQTCCGYLIEEPEVFSAFLNAIRQLAKKEFEKPIDLKSIDEHYRLHRFSVAVFADTHLLWGLKQRFFLKIVQEAEQEKDLALPNLRPYLAINNYFAALQESIKTSRVDEALLILNDAIFDQPAPESLTYGDVDILIRNAAQCENPTVLNAILNKSFIKEHIERYLPILQRALEMAVDKGFIENVHVLLSYNQVAACVGGNLICKAIEKSNVALTFSLWKVYPKKSQKHYFNLLKQSASQHENQYYLFKMLMEEPRFEKITLQQFENLSCASCNKNNGVFPLLASHPKFKMLSHLHLSLLLLTLRSREYLMLLINNERFSDISKETLAAKTTSCLDPHRRESCFDSEMLAALLGTPQVANFSANEAREIFESACEQRDQDVKKAVELVIQAPFFQKVDIILIGEHIVKAAKKGQVEVVKILIELPSVKTMMHDVRHLTHDAFTRSNFQTLVSRALAEGEKWPQELKDQMSALIQEPKGNDRLIPKRKKNS